MRRSEKREHLVDVALRQFTRLGYRAVGIDLVIAESGVAKTTLYRHFKSKEDLIVAVLRRIDEDFRNAMRHTVDAASGDGRAKLLATFDYLERWLAGDGFHGCPFVSAAGEYGGRNNPVFQEAAMHKRLMLAYFEELARAAGLDDPAGMAGAINLLHEGATAVAHVSADPSAASRAKAIAARLLAA